MATVTRDEYLAVLSTEPATSTQIGAILGEFARLGVADRAERLTITAALLALEDLGSTTDLVMGQAGYLVNLLQRTRDRAELPDATAAAGDEDQADAERITLPEAILRIIVMIYAASTGKGATGNPADISLNTASANPERAREDDISR